jgi:hypothetical protein
MPNVEIKLVEPIKTHDGEAKVVILRPPKYADVFALGEPQAFAVDPNTGMMFTTDKDEVIEKYIERICIEPKDSNWLVQCGLADSLALRDAVLGFFRDARAARTTASPNS